MAISDVVSVLDILREGLLNICLIFFMSLSLSFCGEAVHFKCVCLEKPLSCHVMMDFRFCGLNMCEVEPCIFGKCELTPTSFKVCCTHEA